MQHTLLAVLACLAIIVVGSHFTLAQTVPVNSSQPKQVKASKLGKIKNKVEKIGVGGKITVIRLDGSDFYGEVRAIEADSFLIDEVDLKQPLAFKYSEIKQIKTGDGQKNLITGRRTNPKRGWLYGLAIFGTLFAVLGIAMSDKDF